MLVDLGENVNPAALMPDVHLLKNTGTNEMCKLNTTQNRRLAIGQKVLGLPTFIVYKKEKIKEISGAENCTPEAIENLIKENI